MSKNGSDLIVAGQYATMADMWRDLPHQWTVAYRNEPGGLVTAVLAPTRSADLLPPLADFGFIYGRAG
jgi:hypothetical protein